MLLNSGMTSISNISPASDELTIIIISYNTRQMTLDCLESVFSAKKTYRVIVVDNNSHDGSARAIRESYPQVEVITNSVNRGFAAANNQALRDTTSKYVLLLNSDTKIIGSVIQDSMHYLELNPKVGAMGCRVLNPDGTPQMTCNRFPGLVQLTQLVLGFTNGSAPAWLDGYTMRSWHRDSERSVDTVTGCYMMLRMSVIDNVGLLDESFFFYGEETDLCRRIGDAGWDLRFAPIGEIIHYGSGSAKSLNAERDVLLTAGLVRLHSKYGGLYKAAISWLILAIFNVSRFLFWSVRALGARSDGVLERRNHFRAVSGRLCATWALATKNGTSNHV
jgi:GT2 family glycosyltransferase